MYYKENWTYFKVRSKSITTREFCFVLEYINNSQLIHKYGVLARCKKNCKFWILLITDQAAQIQVYQWSETPKYNSIIKIYSTIDKSGSKWWLNWAFLISFCSMSVGPSVCKFLIIFLYECRILLHGLWTCMCEI